MHKINLAQKFSLSELVRQQLAKAGYRLAKLLDAIYARN
jgi:hypothetical protein